MLNLEYETKHSLTASNSLAHSSLYNGSWHRKQARIKVLIRELQIMDKDRFLFFCKTKPETFIFTIHGEKQEEQKQWTQTKGPDAFIGQTKCNEKFNRPIIQTECAEGNKIYNASFTTTKGHAN